MTPISKASPLVHGDFQIKILDVECHLEPFHEGFNGFLFLLM